MKQVNFFVGTAGNDCQSGSLEDGRQWASFRLAVNFGYYDTERGEYREIDTSWYDVSCYGDLALNVTGSIRKGDAVIVAGRLRIREWKDSATNKSGRAPQIIAEAVGHNLRFGTSRWARNSRNAARAAESGAPSASWDPGHAGAGGEVRAADTSDDIDETMVDRQTGEISSEHVMESV